MSDSLPWQTLTANGLATEFHLFPYLPWEIRRMIWLYCIEGRVVELNVPQVRYSSSHSENCISWTTHQNTRPPVVTRICQESRQAALSQCAWTLAEGEAVNPSDDYITTRSPWFNPAKDIVAFNSLDCTYQYESEDEESSYFMQCAKQAQGVVIPARMLYPFRYLRLPMEVGESNPKIPRTAADQFSQLGGFMVCLKSIEVHMPPDKFLQSTLSGRTGDSLVRVVDVFDAAQIEKIYGEVKDVSFQDEDVTAVFKLLCNTKELYEAVAKWQEEVKMNWLCQRYGSSHSLKQRIYDEEHSIPPRNLECFLNPAGSGPDAEPTTRARFIESYRAKPPRFDEFTFDISDPWVQWAHEDMPIFRPVLMFRLCVRGCASLCSTGTRRSMYSGRYLRDYTETLMSQYILIRRTERAEEQAMAADSRIAIKRL